MKHTHGSEAVQEGRVRGATDRTDYFYFFCPDCADDRLLRVLDYQVTRDDKGNDYNDSSRFKAARSFVIAFEIACEQCGFRDRVKLSSIGWQGGTHSEALRRLTQEA
jgi:predicted RNA-binding Zn-ribbon protein involved in translation (DUF1610 family)